MNFTRLDFPVLNETVLIQGEQIVVKIWFADISLGSDGRAWLTGKLSGGDKTPQGNTWKRDWDFQFPISTDFPNEPETAQEMREILREAVHQTRLNVCTWALASLNYWETIREMTLHSASQPKMHQLHLSDLEKAFLSQL